MKQSIGRELLKLFQTERHITSLEEYYEGFLKGDKDIGDLNEEYIDDHSLLYMSVQHLASFDEMEINDLMKHHIGFGLNIIKRGKIFEILKDRENFIQKIRGKAKSKIFDILNRKGQTTFSDDAEHYFLGSRFSVVFEIEADSQKNEIRIIDIYVGEKYDRDEYNSNPYIPMIGLVF